MEIKCSCCGHFVEQSFGNICPNCGNKLNNHKEKEKEGLKGKIKNFLARFKRANTVEEWKREAQLAIKEHEFVIGSLAELHRCEKADMGMQRQQQQNYARNQQYAVPQFGMPNNTGYPQQNYAQTNQYNRREYDNYNNQAINQAPRERNKAFSEVTLKSLLEAVAQEQKMN